MILIQYIDIKINSIQDIVQITKIYDQNFFLHDRSVASHHPLPIYILTHLIALVSHNFGFQNMVSFQSKLEDQYQTFLDHHNFLTIY